MWWRKSKMPDDATAKLWAHPKEMDGAAAKRLYEALEGEPEGIYNYREMLGSMANEQFVMARDIHALLRETRVSMRDLIASGVLYIVEYGDEEFDKGVAFSDLPYLQTIGTTTQFNDFTKMNEKGTIYKVTAEPPERHVEMFDVVGGFEINRTALEALMTERGAASRTR